MALDIISTINLDLKRPNTETVYAVQYDTAGRIKAQLTNDGEAWHVPSSAGGMVSFRKSDNIGGFYDTTELGEVAVSVDENDDSVIYIALDAQTTITATPLDHPVQMQINFYNSQGKRLSTFAFYLRVQASVLFDGDQDERPVASEWTFRILTGALGQTIKNQEEAIKWMEDNIRTQEGYVVDDTLKVKGAAGDAKKIGELFEEIVKISDSMPGYFPTTDTARVGNTKYYTRSGTAPNYVYTEFTGATFATGVTYYEYSPWNRIWIDPDDNDVAIPTMDEFDDLKSAISPLYSETELTLVANSYWPSAGQSAGIPASYKGWLRTNRIPCVAGETLIITTTVRSAYNIFFNSDTDGDVNSAFTLNVGENVIKVPNGAVYFGLSNTDAGMNGTKLVKIIDASEVRNAESNASEALIGSANNAKSIDTLERYVGMISSSVTEEIQSLVVSSSVVRRTDYFPVTFLKSVSVNAVSGYQHNINYYKVSPSDSDAVSEAGWQDNVTTFAKPKGYLYGYVRFRKADRSAFTDTDVATLLESLTVTLDYDTISTTEQTVYVSPTGADTNNGSKTSPFATLQKAVDSGALIVKASAGDYTGFSVQNRENSLTIMLDSMPVYSTDNPEVPKIKITTGVTGGYGIYANNCTEINLFDVWVDGVMADCMWLQNIGNVNCTRCFVSNNTANNSMGIRLISVNGVFRDCKAWNIVKDGFNIHRYGNTQFVNCVAYDCGDDGISHHDGCTGLISGGEYYRCYKGGISSPYGGSKIDIENVYIHDCTQYGIYSMSTSEMLKSAGRISNCVIKNNGTYDIIASYTDLIGWNNIYDTKSIGTQATFTEF